MSDWASDGGHFYLPDGTPYYTVIGANGKEHQATLRDARKVGAYPGSTTIIKCAAAPGLEKWKRGKVLLSGLTMPRLPHETEESWLARIEEDWQKEGRDAADRGTVIHGAIEGHYLGKPPDEAMWPWVKIVRDTLLANCGPQEWLPEKAFASPLGYGTKIDLHSSEWIIDFKGKDDAKLDGPTYDEHDMQIAAGRNLLREKGWTGQRGAILFVSRTEPKARFVEIEEPDLQRGLNLFQALLTYWRHKNKYFP